MVSRVGLVTVLVLMSAVAISSSAARQPPTGAAMYLVSPDPRLCPSPLCGGHWVAIANGARTRGGDATRQARCYVAKIVRLHDPSVGVAVPEGALVRAALDVTVFDGIGSLGVLEVAAAYAPAGNAPLSGGYYRVVDNGIRCVRAPCFSYRVTAVNGSTRTPVSSIDLQASGSPAAQVARAQAALRTKNGLYARGRFARMPDGGTVFRALRLYLRAPLSPA